jgi:energy-coupling factor transporter ATP-binding protein EcfA2
MLSGRPLLPTAADGRYLVERSEVDRVVQDVEAGMNTLVLAERGMGKTTFLRHVGARVEEEAGFTAVYLDGHRLTDATTILLAVRDALSGPRTAFSDNLRATAMTFTPMPVEVRNEQALALVRELGSATEGQKVCVLLDDPDPDTAHRLFGRLRDDLWQTGIAWVVAGDEARRQEYLTPPADAFFERVVELAPLSDNQQHELIHRRLNPGDDRGVLAAKVESGNPRSLLAALREAASPHDAQASLERRAERQTRAADELGRLASMMLAEIEDGAAASASDPEWLKRFGVSRQRAQQVLAGLEREELVKSERLPGPTGRPRKVYRRVDAPASA